MPAKAIHSVLIPGLACSARLYDTLMPYVWAHGPVTIADTRRDAAVSAMAKRLLDDAPERFALAGISMGGYIALEVVRQAPERVQALALISTSARPDTPQQAASRRQQLALARAGRYGDVVTAAFPALVDPRHRDDPDLAGFWSLTAREVGPDAFCTQLTAVINRPDSRPTLSTINCPTTVIHGAGDQLIPLDQAHESAAGIPQATLTVVDAAGHMAAQEEPIVVGAALDDLLSKLAQP